MNLFQIGILAGGLSLVCLAGCKTEINNPPASSGTTVIHEDRPGSSVTPPVQNNIKVDR